MDETSEPVAVSANLSTSPGAKLDGTASLATELARFALLRHVKPERLDSLAERGVLRTLETGETLLHAGELNSTLYLVLAGSFTVHLTHPESDPIAVLGPGESIGELSILDQRPASAHVIARARSCTLAIPEPEFLRLLETSHAFSVNLVLKLADRLRTSNLAISASVEQRESAFERAAIYDAVTGVHNRAWLDGTLPRWIEHHERSGRPLCAALADLDHFKSLNDRFGHAAGDTLLAAVASAWQAALRQTDRVARYGGEEFAILLPDTDLERAIVTAERLREVAAELHVRDSRGQLLPPWTVSIGVAEWAPGLDGKSLLDRADATLYRAKRAGRNRVGS